MTDPQRWQNLSDEELDEYLRQEDFVPEEVTDPEPGYQPEKET